MKKVMFLLMAMAVLLTSCGKDDCLQPGDTYQGGIVVDVGTLMMAPNDIGSTPNQVYESFSFPFDTADVQIAILNRELYLGFDNWRVPNTDEAQMIYNLAHLTPLTYGFYSEGYSYWVKADNGYTNIAFNIYNSPFKCDDPLVNGTRAECNIRAVRTYTE
jgi:hypothetical protein